MWTHGSTCEMKVRIENILAMLSRSLPVVNDEGDHDVTRVRFSVGNIFSPASTPNSVAIHSFTRIGTVGAGVTEAAALLISDMFGCA